MITNLPPNFTNALNATTRKPIQLAHIHINGTTCFVSDAPLGPADGLINTYEPMVESWGTFKDTSNLNASFTGKSLEIKSTQLSLIVTGDKKALFLDALETGIDNSIVELYQYFLDDPNEPPQLIDILVAQDPIQFSESSSLFKIDAVSVLMINNPYLWSRGVEELVRPIVVGKMPNMPLIDEQTSRWTTISEDLAIDYTGELYISNGVGFRAGPDTVVIDSEIVAYEWITASTINITARGQGGTEARAHISGALMCHVDSVFDYTVCSGPVLEVTDMAGDGEPYLNQYTVLANQDPVVVRFYGRPPWLTLFPGGGPPIDIGETTVPNYGSDILIDQDAPQGGGVSDPQNINSVSGEAVLSLSVPSAFGPVTQYETRISSMGVVPYGNLNDDYTIVWGRTSNPSGPAYLTFFGTDDINVAYSESFPQVGATGYITGSYDVSWAYEDGRQFVRADIEFQFEPTYTSASAANLQILTDDFYNGEDLYYDNTEDHSQDWWLGVEPTVLPNPWNGIWHLPYTIPPQSVDDSGGGDLGIKLVFTVEGVTPTDDDGVDVRQYIQSSVSLYHPKFIINYKEAPDDVTDTPFTQLMSNFGYTLESLGTLVSVAAEFKFDLVVSNANTYQSLIISRDFAATETLWERYSADTIQEEIITVDLGITDWNDLANASAGMFLQITGPNADDVSGSASSNFGYVKWLVTYLPPPQESPDEDRVVYADELTCTVTSMMGADPTPAQVIQRLIQDRSGSSAYIDYKQFDTRHQEYLAEDYYFNGILDGDIRLHEALKICLREGMARFLFGQGKIGLLNYSTYEDTYIDQTLTEDDVILRSRKHKNQPTSTIVNDYSVLYNNNPAKGYYEDVENVTDANSIARFTRHDERIDFTFIRSSAIARKIADNQIRVLANPISVIQLDLLMSAYTLQKGDFVQFTSLYTQNRSTGHVGSINRVFGKGKSNQMNKFQMFISDATTKSKYKELIESVYMSDKGFIGENPYIRLYLTDTILMAERNLAVDHKVGIYLLDELFVDDSVFNQSSALTVVLSDIVEMLDPLTTSGNLRLGLSDIVQMSDDVYQYSLSLQLEDVIELDEDLITSTAKHVKLSESIEVAEVIDTLRGRQLNLYDVVGMADSVLAVSKNQGYGAGGYGDYGYGLPDV